MSGVPSITLNLIPLRQALSLNGKLIILAKWLISKCQEYSPPPPRQVLALWACIIIHSFLWDAGELNPGPDVYTENAFAHWAIALPPIP